MNPILGDEDCTFLEVCNELQNPSSFSALLKKLMEIALKLELPADQIHVLDKSLKMQTMAPFEAMWKILASWRAKLGDKAKLSLLLNVLEECDLKASSDALRSYFKIKGDPSATFVCSPEGFDHFLQSEQSILVISSPDKKLTVTKLLDTRSTTHTGELYAFLSRLAAGTGANNEVYSVICSEDETLSEMLGSIEESVMCKGVIITGESLENAQLICSYLDHVTLIRDAIKWSHLNTTSQNILLGKNAKISGKCLALREVLQMAKVGKPLNDILGEQILISLLNCNEPILTRSNIPQPISYYIQRRLCSRNLLSTAEIFKKDRHDIFLFTGIERHELSKLTSSQSTDSSTNQRRKHTPTVRYMILDMISDFEAISKKVNVPVHWIDHNVGNFFWRRSSEHMRTIQKAIKSKQKQSSFSEEEFINILKQTSPQNRPVILSDTPGMGKTLILANLARKLISMGEIVLFGNMSKLVADLNKMLEAGEQMENALIHLISSLAGQGKLSQMFLKNLIISGGHQITVMLDGCDEVISSDLELTGKICKKISSFSSVRLWVTTRPHLLEGLENYLEVLAYNIEPFSSQDQRDCLIRYWKHTSSLEEGRLEKFANHCLDYLHKTMKSSNQDIAGIPLQCMLISEVLEEEASNYANPGNLTSELLPLTIEVRSLADLYVRLMEKKFRMYSQRHPSDNKYTSDQLKQAHMFLSIQLLFPEMEENFQEALSLGRNVQLQDVLHIGLLEMMNDDGIPTFLHRSVAEFFVALLVLNLINDDRVCSSTKGKLLDTLLECENHEVKIFNPVSLSTYIDALEMTLLPSIKSSKFKHFVIAFFIDNFIEDLSTQELDIKSDIGRLAQACAVHNFPHLFNFFSQTTIFEEQQKYLVDDNLLFICVRHCDVELIAKVCQVYEKVHRFRVRDVMKDRIDHVYTNLLLVAVSHQEYTVVDYLIDSLGFKELLERNDETIKEILHHLVAHSRENDDALIHQKMQVVKLLADINPKLLQNGNQHKETPLLSFNVHFKLLQELVLRLGSNVLAVNADNFNVLHTAINLNAQEYNALVTQIPHDQLAQLLQMRNKFMRTPLHAVVLSCDPEPATLELFRQLGADFNAVDGKGNSVLDVAVENFRSVSTIERLIHNGADWTILHPGGWTILHTALKTCSFPIFQYLSLRLLEQTNNLVLQKWRHNLNQENYDVTRNTTLEEMQQKLTVARDWADLENLDLRDLSFDANAKYPQNNTTLLHLIVNHHSGSRCDVTRLLLQSGANVHAEWNEVTAFELATGYYLFSSELMSLLESYGAISSIVMANKFLSCVILNMTSSDNLEDFKILCDKVLRKWPEALHLPDENGETLLHRAVTSSEAASGATYLIQKGASIGSRNLMGETPLHKAATSSISDEMCRLLVDNGADWNILDNEGHSPLYSASIHQKTENIKYLLSIQAYCDEQSFVNCLLATILAGNLDAFQAFLDCLSSENKLSKWKFGGRLKTLLHYAAGSTDSAIFENLVEKQGFGEFLSDPIMDGIVHTIIDNVGEALSAKKGRRVVLESFKNLLDYVSLLDCRFAVNEATGLCDKLFGIGTAGFGTDSFRRTVEENSKFQSFLETAREQVCAPDDKIEKRVHGAIKMLELIKRKNPSFLNALDPEGNTPVLRSCISLELLNWFLDNGADVNAVDNEKRNVVHLALDHLELEEFEKVVKHLVEKGYGELLKGSTTVLHKAIATAGREDISRSTLEHFRKSGADFSARDEDGDSVLIYAMKANKGKNFLRNLVELGGDCSVSDKNQFGLLHWACIMENVGAVELFASKCEVNATTTNLNTPLHMTLGDFKRVNLQMAKIIIEAGADLTAQNIHGISPIDPSKHVGLLHMAAKYKDVDLIRLLISNGVGVRDKNNFGARPMHYAVIGKSERFVETINILLENGAFIDDLGDDGLTPLHWAVQKVKLRLEAIEFLVQKGANVYATNIEQRNILHFAAATRNAKDYQILLEWASKQSLEKLIQGKDFFRTTSFLYAIRYLEFEENTLDVLLKYYDINEMDRVGNNVLFQVISGGKDANFLEQLVRKGAKVAVENMFKQTPLHSAVCNGNLDAIKFLIANNVDMNARDCSGHTPIHMAVKEVGTRELMLSVVNLLVKGGADVHATDNMSGNILHIAAENQNLEVYQGVIEYAEKNSLNVLFEGRTKNQSTPLHSAVFQFELDEATLATLLKYNGINSVDSDGDNVLFYAIQGNKGATFLTRLIDKGAAWEVRNNNKDTILHFSARWGNVEAVKLFISLGCEVNARNETLQTPVHSTFEGLRVDPGRDEEMITMSLIEIVGVLLENGADRDAQDSLGRTAFGLAVEKFFN